MFLATCQIDLAFIVDTSGSIGYFNFIDMLGFMKKVTRGLNIGPGDSQVAVVSFSNTARLEFGFEEHQDHASLERAMNIINYDAGGTATNKGIKLARESVFETSSRKSATKVALVITDGSSDSFQDTINEAKITKEAGIVLFALGIGNINKAELKAISSPPECTHVILLAGFSEIDNVVQEIEKAACRGRYMDLRIQYKLNAKKLACPCTCNVILIRDIIHVGKMMQFHRIDVLEQSKTRMGIPHKFSLKKILLRH